MRTYFLSVIILIFPALQFAQTQQMEFEHISLEQGLSQAAVNAVVQDGQGFMWFGTLDGLNRYDGYEIKIYKHDPLDTTSISHNKIMALCVDRNGNLWISTDGGGLNRFNYQSETFTSYRHNDSNPNSISSDYVRGIYEDTNGMIWVGSLVNGIDRFDPGSESFAHYPITTLNNKNSNVYPVISIYEQFQDDRQILWMGTYGGGLIKFYAQDKSYKLYTHEPENPNSLSNNIVWSVYEINENGEFTLLIATYGGGLDQFNPDKEIFRHHRFDPNNTTSLSNDYVTAIYPNSQDETKLWIATEDGLNQLNVPTREFNNYKHIASDFHSLSSSRIRSICRDRSGTIWFGTMGAGINKYSPIKVRFSHYKQEPDNPNSLNDNFIRSIYEGNSNVLWVGTGTGGLNKIEFDHNEVLHYTHDPNNKNSLSNNSVRAIYEDRYGIIWLGTEGGGLDRFDPLTEYFTHFRNDINNQNSISNNNVWVISKDPHDENNLWIGTYGSGLDKIVLTSEQYNSTKIIRKPAEFIHYKHNPVDSNSLSSDKILAICHDQLGNLWVGTADGLNLFDKSTKKFTCYKNDPGNPKSLSNNTITSILQDGSGFLWVGTFGGGLNKYDYASNIFQHFTENSGLPNNNVSGILEDNSGNLWISTYNGLTKFNPKTETFRNFNISDGLQSNEFGYGAYHKSKNGRMYFGGINGFNVFHPDSIKNNPNIPPVVITDFRVFNKSVKLNIPSGKTNGGSADLNISGEIVLSYEQNVFSFEFAALDYTSPEKNIYAYKLEGIDKDWIYSGNRRYASYTHIPAGEYLFQVKGTNNDGVWNEAGASVRIVITPPFWETWWFRALALLFLIGLLYSLYRYRVSKLIEMERLRVRIASDLHDDLGSALTKISVHSEIIQNTADAEKISTSSKKIGEMSRDIVTSLRDIVWSIDARNDTIGDMLDRMRNFALSVLSPKEIEALFNVQGLENSKKLSVNVRQNIYLIFKEAINNIVKHSQATKVNINIQQISDEFLMRISDNGSGFVESENHTGSGLRNMKARSKRIGAQLIFEVKDGLIITLKMKSLG